MSHIEAMKQALDALVKTLRILADANERGVITDTLWFSEYETLFDYLESEITSLRQAIAEAEKQKLVANASTWFALVMNAAAELEDASHCLRDEDAKRVAISGAKHYRDAANALYTHPQPKREPLTDEQIWQFVNDSTIGGDLHADKFARAIEAAHGIKENT